MSTYDMINNIGPVTGSKSQDGLSRVDERLSSVFSIKQLAMMETAFERNFNHDFLGGDLFYECRNFTSGCSDPKERIIKIITNAINNWGTFKP